MSTRTVTITNVEDALTLPSAGEKRRSSLRSSMSSDCDSTSCSSSSSSKPRVKFDKITIRNYNVTISDHPSCSSGAPIGLSWEYDPDHIEVPVERFEMLREGNRRNRGQMQMPAQIRHDLLRYEFDVSTKDILHHTKEVYHAKKRRIQSAKQAQRRARVDCLVDSATKPFRRMVKTTTV